MLTLPLPLFDYYAAAAFAALSPLTLMPCRFAAFFAFAACIPCFLMPALISFLHASIFLRLSILALRRCCCFTPLTPLFRMAAIIDADMLRLRCHYA